MTPSRVVTLAAVALVMLVGAACSKQASLEKETWVLEAYGRESSLQAVLQASEITAVFDSAEGQVSGSAGCNRYFTSYETKGNELTIIPPIGSTMMACPEPVMEQEQQYFSLLKTSKTFQVENSKLTVWSSGNQMLVFVAHQK